MLLWTQTRHGIPCALLCLYPPFFVYTRTDGLAGGDALLIASFVGLGFAALLYLLIWCSMRRTPHPGRTAGILATVIASYSLVYGHLFSLLYQGTLDYLFHRREANLPDGLVKVFLHAMLLLFLVWLFLFVRRKLSILTDSSQERLYTVSLFFAALLLVMAQPLTTLFDTTAPSVSPATLAVTANHAETLPDIYHIVLDGYARQDVLANHYGYDNQGFIASLRSLGFQVSPTARANYNWTFLSLGSMLNRAYINDDTHPQDRSWKAGTRLLRNNRVSKELKARGYTYIHMASTWGATLDNDNADRVHRCGGSVMQNEYYRVLIEGSLLRVLTFLGSQNLAECHRQNFQWLGHSADGITGPAYVFAHFIPPHHPYLFQADGSIRKHATLSDQFDFQQVMWSDRDSYLSQLQYVNREILDAVTRILTRRDRPTVILIQSDHGPQLVTPEREMEAGFHEARAAIFLAIKMPEPVTDLPDSAINIYRWLYNQLFGEALNMLPYHYYTSPFEAPYRYQEIHFNGLNETGTAPAANRESDASPAG